MTDKQIIYYLLRMLFSRTGFKKMLSNLPIKQLKEHEVTAIEKENYELAAYLKYYIKLKDVQRN